VDQLTEKIGKVLQSAISNHLRVLRNAGLITPLQKKDSRYHYYVVRQETLDKAIELIERLR
jgi:DNA-binding transcriptional ArsR family regulator